MSELEVSTAKPGYHDFQETFTDNIVAKAARKLFGERELDDKLRIGYKEMAAINLSLCDEMFHLENELYLDGYVLHA